MKHPRFLILLCLGVVVCIFLYAIALTFTDNSHYSNLSERATEARQFACSHNLNENYCLFVDYNVPSGTPRMYVWSFNENRVVAKTYVMHGPGKGSTDETPVFSNLPGSKCSSLGRFEVTKEHGKKLARSYKLRGLDWTGVISWLILVG